MFVSRTAWSREDVDPASTASEMLTAAARTATDKGLALLAKQQNEDGSFGLTSYGRNVGVCGLAGMAFLSQGSSPGRGPYGRQISRCIDYVLSHVQDSGYMIAPDSAGHGPMYGHGFATMFLGETYGMSPRRDLRDKLSRAVQLIVDTQNPEGGWRYQPQPLEADVSVTVCEIMALRAARNAGLYVPEETIQRSVAYLRGCQNPDGGFMYLASGGPSEFPRSAAGVVGLFSAGIYEGTELELGLKYLEQFRPRDLPRSDESHFLYGHYYAVRAMWLNGGARWQAWFPAIRDLLIRLQREDGGWDNPICPEYGAAMATIILQLPNQAIPIFQR